MTSLENPHTRLTTKHRLNARGKEEYARFKLLHVERIEEFSKLLEHMVRECHLPVDILLDPKQQQAALGAHNVVAEKTINAWSDLLAAADTHFKGHDKLCETMKDHLRAETAAAGVILKKSATKRINGRKNGPIGHPFDRNSDIPSR